MRHKSVSFLALLCVPALLAQGPPPRPPRPGGPPGGRGGGDGIWMRNALLAERPAFDPCNAHQPPSGEYHYHADPVCLRLQLNDNILKTGSQYSEAKAPWRHSPILAWAYDGNPVYGPYAYSNPRDPSSPIVRIRSSFRLRDIAQRHTLAAWSAELHNVNATLPEKQYGPDVSAAHPLGWYVEDFDFVAYSGDLDLYNGRFTITPEYPNGTYAYFVTIDVDGGPSFPYVLGRQYYGAVPSRQSRVTAGRIETFHPGESNDPSLTSWLTKNNEEFAHVVDAERVDAERVDAERVDAERVDAEKPEETSVVTWPGQNRPAHPDISEVLYSDKWIYVGGSGLASHLMGPWYGPDGSVFRNWPIDQNFQDRFPRRPEAAVIKSANMLGSLGRWVNGVALFNMLDGASWSNQRHDDVMSPPPGGPPPMPDMNRNPY
jgi:hypothetical protein